MESYTDRKILEKYIFNISNEDLFALEQLYNETREFVFRYALSIMKNASDAEDVMQDTYININRYASNYNPRNKPLAWILTITKNLCLNKLKANKKKQILDIDDVEFMLGSKDEEAFNKALIKSILEELDEEERQIFMLNTINDFKFREIAELMDLKLSTVLSKYHRAMKKVREKYKDGE